MTLNTARLNHPATAPAFAHDRAASLRLHRTVPAIESSPATRFSARKPKSLARNNKTWMLCSGSKGLLGDFDGRPWKCRCRQSDHTPLGGVVLFETGLSKDNLSLRCLMRTASRQDGCRTSNDPDLRGKRQRRCTTSRSRTHWDGCNDAELRQYMPTTDKPEQAP
jgi:hypothetical protein